MNRVKFICLVPYGWKGSVEVGEIVEVKFNEENRIQILFIKNKGWMFHGSNEVFYKHFISMAEYRDKQIETILNE